VEARLQDGEPDRAVIDIGSNTVRLVVYAGSMRVPEVWLNERVSAKLGRELSTTGRLPEKAMDNALKALARYATIVADLGIKNVQTVATAAVREAANGAEFLARVGKLGLRPRLLTGEEEAFGSAFGVIGAFPEARGTVADLGGGSLELVMVEQGDCHDGISLPLGTLRLTALRANGPAAFRKAIKREMAKAGWAAAHPGPLFMVGGTWRALAVFAMRDADFPVTDPHGYALDAQAADRLAKRVARMDPSRLAALPRISSARAAGLPDAAAMLRCMLSELQPDGIVFSSWGLREGLLFQQLPPPVRRHDPLLAAVTRFCEPRGGSPALAAMIGAWIAEIAPAKNPEAERLRLAATMLALAAAHVEPNHRARHAYEWAMDKRWVGLNPQGRARMAAALVAACGKMAPGTELERLAGPELLSDAVAWGLAIRLCRRLGAGSRVSLLTSRLERDGETLTLWMHPSRAQLMSDQVSGDLKTLAEWFGLQPKVEVSERPATRSEPLRHSEG
jgi:exopolyphosphatase/guanosine-5'-triphosphate,3'-diphosphate pyrophosphatase